MRISIHIRPLVYAVFVLLTASSVGRADDGKSFSRQMNEIKRSGAYIYSESSATNEAEAKEACDALLKIEITKFLTSDQSRADARIVKDIADYHREYLVQPRGDMVRVFGYIAKNSFSGEDGGKPEAAAPAAEEKKADVPVKAEEKKADIPVKQEKAEVTKEHAAETPIQTSENEPKTIQKTTPSTQTVSGPLKTDGLQLAKWQTDMLEGLAKEPDMTQAKKVLNRYKSQNRIKRSGDRSVSNPRPADTFYLIYGRSGNLVALLAPSASDRHFDMLTGTTTNLNDYKEYQHIWFQISQ